MPITAFSEGYGPSVFKNHPETLVKEIRGLENSYVLRASPTELEQFYLGKALIDPIILRIDECHVELQKSIKIDARYDRNRVFFDRSGPCLCRRTDARKTRKNGWPGRTPSSVG
jgi:hypothetical protein